jgi:hypothetical protein
MPCARRPTPTDAAFVNDPMKDRTMPRPRLSFTERRRRKLALSIAQLERLESRSTVTPFAAFRACFIRGYFVG